jgi:hypothetical protein
MVLRLATVYGYSPGLRVHTVASVNQIIALLRRHFPRMLVVHTDKEILNQISYEVDGGKLLRLGFSMDHSLEDGVEEYARLYSSFARMPMPLGPAAL